MDTKDLLASTDDLLASSTGMGSIPPQLIGDDDFLMSSSIPSENSLTQTGATQDDIVNLIDTSTSSTTSFESKHLINRQQSSALTLDDADHFLKALQPKSAVNDNPVSDIIYWKNVKLTGVIFASGLYFLFFLTHYPIHIVLLYSYICLFGGFAFCEAYLQLELDELSRDKDFRQRRILFSEIRSPKEKIITMVEIIVDYASIVVDCSLRFFFFEDLKESLVFWPMLRLLAEIFSLIEPLTLAKISFVALFSLPKLYEMIEPRLDGYITSVHV